MSEAILSILPNFLHRDLVCAGHHAQPQATKLVDIITGSDPKKRAFSVLTFVRRWLMR
jgi:hypothetical protein